MTAITPEMAAAIERVALARGDVRVLMHRHQLRAHDLIESMPMLEWAFLLWTRRGGKTEYCVHAVHLDALSRPGMEIRYACPTKVHARDTVVASFQRLAEKLPAHLRPEYNQMQSTFVWPNGSRCILGG